MDSRKLVLKETGAIALGEGIGVALMYGVFALLGALDQRVLLGGLAGGVLAVLNFFLMAVNLSNAANKAAAQQDAKSGKTMVRFSYITRLALLFVVLLALVKSGLCDALASVIPLVFVRFTIMMKEFFGKKPEEDRA